MDSISSEPPQGKPHYTYALCYPADYPDEKKAGTVFYIGKGHGNRIDAHERLAKQGKGPNPYQKNVIRKIWANGGQVIKKILAWFETHEEACLHEIALIFFMDDRLTNLTYGGEGAWGQVKSAEARRKLSEANRGRPSPLKGKPGKRPSIETRRKIGAAGKGRAPHNKGKPGPLVSEATRQKLSAAQKNSPLAKEKLQRLHISNLGRKRSQETRKKIGAAKRGKPNPLSEDGRRRMIAAKKGKKQDPEVVRKIAAINTGKKRSEETRQKMRQPHPSMKGRTPPNKGKPMSEEQRAKMVGRKASIETRQKLRESHKGQIPWNKGKSSVKINPQNAPLIIWPSDLLSAQEYANIGQLLTDWNV